jgi:serine/threonine protein kinase
MQSLPLCVQLLEAVVFIHSLGAVHGDIKSENALVQLRHGELARLMLADLAGGKVVGPNGMVELAR